MLGQLAGLRRQAGGLLTEQVAISAGSPLVGRRLGDTRARTLTGASIVAVLRDREVIASPGPSFVFEGRWDRAARPAARRARPDPAVRVLDRHRGARRGVRRGAGTGATRHRVRPDHRGQRADARTAARLRLVQDESPKTHGNASYGRPTGHQRLTRTPSGCSKLLTSIGL